MLFFAVQVIPEDRDLSVFMYIAAFLYFCRIEDQVLLFHNSFLERLVRRAVHIHRQSVSGNDNVNQLGPRSPLNEARRSTHSSTLHRADAKRRGISTVIKRSTGRRVRIPTRKI